MYEGLSWDEANATAMRLIRMAADTGEWHCLVERLDELRDIVRSHIKEGVRQEIQELRERLSQHS